LPARWGFLLTRPFRQLRQLGDFGGDGKILVTRGLFRAGFGGTARRQAATAPLEDPPAEPVLRRGSAGVRCFRFLDARDSCYARSGDAQSLHCEGCSSRSSAKPQTAPAGTGRRLQGMASMGASPKSGSGNDGCAWLPAKTVERRENPCKDAVRPCRS
jgi:hypothetical protein